LSGNEYAAHAIELPGTTFFVSTTGESAMAKKARNRTYQGVYVGGNYLEPAIHRALKAAAKANERTLNREIVLRLRLSVEAEQQEKNLQAAEYELN
jgi:hypothetical protein